MNHKRSRFAHLRRFVYAGSSEHCDLTCSQVVSLTPCQRLSNSIRQCQLHRLGHYTRIVHVHLAMNICVSLLVYTSHGVGRGAHLVVVTARMSNEVYGNTQSEWQGTLIHSLTNH
jgi:hypothetical protein